MAHRKLLNTPKNMSSRRAKYAGIVAAAWLLMFVLSGCALTGPRTCYLGSYQGRILDVDTGAPIEGAVVHVTYWKYGASAAGAIGAQVAVRETLTDADGNYLISKDTVHHKCFSGKLRGQMQVYKPGYGTPAHNRARKSCPENEREEVPWADEPRCLTVAGKYLTWELPKLKTREERERNLIYVHPAYDIPNREQSKLRKALSEERISLGYPPLSDVEPGEIK